MKPIIFFKDILDMLKTIDTHDITSFMTSREDISPLFTLFTLFSPVTFRENPPLGLQFKIIEILFYGAC